MTMTTPSDHSLQSGFLAQLNQLADLADFRDWARGPLRALLPHDMFVCVACHIHAGGFSLDHILCIDFPAAHFQRIRNPAGAIDTPIARRWLVERRPQSFDPANPWPDVPADWLNHFRHSGLGKTLTHAFVDDAQCVGSYFGFHRLHHSATAHEMALVEQLVPLLHPVFLRLMRHYVTNQANFQLPTLNGEALRPSLQTIARLISEGKSNADIAQDLELSQNTVKHRVSELLAMTGCANRAALAVRIQHSRLPPQGTQIL